MQVEGDALVARRRMEGCEQVVRLQLPAVVSVLPEINAAPIPGLKAVLAAKKKPVDEVEAGELGIDEATGVELESVRGYASDRKNVLIEGDSTADVAAKLIDVLKKEGVL